MKYLLAILLVMQFSNVYAEGAITGGSVVMEKAIFAGGCFWCMEPPFERLDGVIEVVSGYTGGYKDNPSYEEVSGGVSGHQEAIQITYDQSKVTYEHLLDAFWMQIDPTDQGGQFADRGEQYKTAIFYFNDKQKEAAEFSKMRLGQSGRFDGPIVTKIIPASKFYTAEGYHQDYYKKNSAHYKRYSAASGREGCLQEKWGGSMKEDGMKGVYNKPDDAELRKMLTPLQYKVAREDGTERAFDNEYWDNKEVGIYVDIVSGEPLFISTDKFVSGTGWPSFAKPLEAGNIAEKEDRSLFRVRTEVRSLHGDSHLGHVFKDGPEPLGLRYCINSASLRFIPKNNLEKEGYGLYNELFE